jgi:ADP-ribosyl-[dinitrogen reductase] hydrolase
VTKRREQIEGAIWGLLVGDALGAPYEFHPASGIPAEHLIELDPPAGFRRSHVGVAPGTWSDDDAHALCLLASLLHCGQLDPEDLMRRLTNWYELGYLAVGGTSSTSASRRRARSRRFDKSSGRASSFETSTARR